MNTFDGSADAKLEDNGRLSLPKSIYYAIDEKERKEIYLTVERDACILAYPKSNWYARLTNPSFADVEDNPKTQQKVRKLQSRMKIAKIDGQGRLYLPSELKQMVGIERDVKIVGLISRLEIWSPEKLEASFQEQIA